jgi:hypothetical protein
VVSCDPLLGEVSLEGRGDHQAYAAAAYHRIHSPGHTGAPWEDHVHEVSVAGGVVHEVAAGDVRHSSHTQHHRTLHPQRSDCHIRNPGHNSHLAAEDPMALQEAGGGYQVVSEEGVVAPGPEDMP